MDESARARRRRVWDATRVSGRECTEWCAHSMRLHPYGVKPVVGKGMRATRSKRATVSVANVQRLASESINTINVVRRGEELEISCIHRHPSTWLDLPVDEPSLTGCKCQHVEQLEVEVECCPTQYR